MAPFTIVVLAYGDHPELLERCLVSLQKYADWSLVDHLRIGLNAVSEQTRKVIHGLFDASSVRVQVFDQRTNVYKYPLMRRMLFDHSYPIRTPDVMWFDDDSFLTAPGVLERCSDLLQTVDVVGRAYRLPNGLRGQQVEWIEKQQWYTGVPTHLGQAEETWFPQGGWWATRMSVLWDNDWPSKELKHRGGDVMFGQVIRQRKLAWARESAGVAVNANEKGQHSRSPRRGFDEQPLGIKLPPPPVDHGFPTFIWGTGDWSQPITEAEEEFKIVRDL